jgi:hypothetical protein
LAPATSRRAWSAAGALVALVAFLPFLRGALAGHAFFFRDLSRQFFPLRRFAVEGLLHGEVRYWNPLMNEGVALSLPALSYPPDLLQLFWRDEAGFSLLLALHVPLAALAFLVLARGLGLGAAAASGGAIAYALGGFSLSTLNFYVYLQAAAWAPLVALGLLRAAQGQRRWLGGAALLMGVALSTTGAEIVGQAVVLGLVLAGPALWRRGLGLSLAAVALSAGLAAPTLVALRAAVAGSARAEGFPTDVVLAQSLHPLTLVQVLVGNWHGDLSDLANRWWGSNFFPSGFPYVLSLYLGATVLALALVGAFAGGPLARRVALLGALGTLVAVGRWAGLASLVDVLPLVHAFRHPSKAFFTAHVCAALLVALAVQELAGPRARRAWTALAALATLLGGTLALAPALPQLAPFATRWFLAGFLPPSYDWPRRVAVCGAILADASRGGLIAVAAAGVALLVLQGHVRPDRARPALVALVAVDLLRAGAGLNPMVTARFYELSPEMQHALAPLRTSGRFFVCEPEATGAYFRARFARGDDHDAWSFAVARETLAPATNVAVGIATAMSRDMTMLVPVHQVLDLDQVGPGAFSSIEERLRRAGVAHVACIDTIASPSLRPRAELAPQRIAPLMIRIFDLAGALPLRAVAREVRPAASAEAAASIAAEPGFQAGGGAAIEGAAALAGATGSVVVRLDAPDHQEFDAESDRPSYLLVRDAFASGWSATVNGAAEPIMRADGRHRAVRIPAGHAHVVLSYSPPGLGFALALAMACLAAALRWLLLP